MGFLGALLLGYAALALQATVVPYVSIAGIRPDLPIVATVFLASKRGAGTGTVGGFLIGLGQDLTNPGFLGLNALAKSILGHSIGSLRERFDARTAATYAAILFVATLVHDFIYLPIFTRLALSEMLLGLATRTLPTAVYTAVVGMWVSRLFGSMLGRRSYRLGRTPLASR
ncbi:MAG: rod shape-determining protein MreD [Candidatus Krumholzibacteriia bacterium]